MNQEDLNKLIKIIETGNKKGNVTLKYGSGGILNLAQGGELTVTENGWLCVVNNENNKVHYINLETVYEIILSLDLE